MLKNTIQVALRNILKHKGYSLINIVGLAAGMACCLLIALWVLDELSFDKFHAEARHLYRVEENQHYSGRNYHVTVTPLPLAPALESEIPEIKQATRFWWLGGRLFRYGSRAFYESDLRVVDPAFLKMFSFPLLRGDPKTALDSPQSLIITEEIAEKYFGDEDPLGKVMTVDNRHSFTVTGLMPDVPHNSFLQFKMLAPYTFVEKIGLTENYSDSFGSNMLFTFVRLESTARPAAVNEKIFGFLRTKNPRSTTDLELMPYTRIHLHAYFGFDRDPGAVQYVYIFSIIAFFVLLIACINFMNLATARSANRAREVGMRKVVGAMRGDLVRRFFGESVVFAGIALVLAVILVTLLLPAFGRLASKPLSWSVSGLGSVLLGLAGVTLFTGLVAGSYPALFLSGFQPVKVLKGQLTGGRGGTRFRRVLVVVQFSLSVLLIIGTAVVYKQLDFMKNKRLGWDREHLVYVPMRGDLKQKYLPLKQELRKTPGVLGVSGSAHLPTNIGSNSGGASWEGKDPDQQVLIGISAVDFDYVETLDIEMAEGRSFSRDHPSDNGKAFLVNEEVVKLMGKESAVGERFQFLGVNGTIIGIMKNYHFQSVHSKIEPLAVIVAESRIEYLLIRLAPGDIPGALKSVEAAWMRVAPDFPLDAHFLDEQFDRMYRAEARMGGLLKSFAGLAILIASLGLFGLASFTAEQRTREIGIRRVLGAGISTITGLLCREFILLVLLANILAWPVGYFVMRGWLQGYPYRTDLRLELFAGALAIALLTALVSVGFHAVRAASANPARSLKYE